MNTMTQSLDIQNAIQHAETRAAQHDYTSAQIYLDLAEALIEGPDERVETARAACIADEIPRRTPDRWTAKPDGGFNFND